MSSDVIEALTGEEAQLAEDVAAFESDETNLTAESEASEEPVAESVAEEAPAPVKTNDQVPLATFLETKNELKEYKNELKALKEALQAQQAQQPAPPVDSKPAFQPTVNYNDDPAEYLKQKIEHQDAMIAWQERQLSGTTQATAQQQQVMQQQAAMAQFRNAVNASEDQFRAVQPDYDNAVEHIRASRMEEARLMLEQTGREWDARTQAQVQQALVGEFAQLAAAALQAGRNPAQALYAMANARGYTPPTANAERALGRIERGHAASRTVSNLSGARASDNTGESGDWFGNLKRGAGYA